MEMSIVNKFSESLWGCRDGNEAGEDPEINLSASCAWEEKRTEPEQTRVQQIP
jgi:hypothetical protein